MSDGANRTTLVTGGAGFIGSHLVEALILRGDRVAVVDVALARNSSPDLTQVAGCYEPHALDLRLRDPSLTRILASLRPSTVFHLAGHANVPLSVKEPRMDFENNAVTMLNVLEAVREAAPAARMVFTSSAAVYGEGIGRPFREDDPTIPLAPYGASKLAAERYVDLYARVYGLRTASVRLFPVYGPRQRRHVIYDLMRKVHDNPSVLPIHGDGQQVRDFAYIADVVAALLLVADAAPCRGETYNVGGDEPMSVAELAKTICERMGAAPRFVYSGEVGAGVSLRWVADITRLRRLGYAPRTRLTEGLTHTVNWFFKTVRG